MCVFAILIRKIGKWYAKNFAQSNERLFQEGPDFCRLFILAWLGHVWSALPMLRHFSALLGPTLPPTQCLDACFLLGGFVCLQVLLTGNRISMGCACGSMRGFDNRSIAKHQIESAGTSPKNLFNTFCIQSFGAKRAQNSAKRAQNHAK